MNVLRLSFSVEGRQLDQVVVRHWLNGLSRLSPGTQSTGDYEHLESFFDQQLRHTGASGFACSSTVEINLSLLRQVLDFFFQAIGFEANRSRDALRVRVIVSMAAHIGDQNTAGGSRG